MGLVGFLRFLNRAVADHDLVLIELAVHILWDYERHAVEVLWRSWLNEHIDLITVSAYCATHVAVVSLHLDRPWLAALVLATAHRSLWILDADLDTTDGWVPLRVVACDDLVWGRWTLVVGWAARCIVRSLVHGGARRAGKNLAVLIGKVTLFYPPTILAVRNEKNGLSASRRFFSAGKSPSGSGQRKLGV